MLRVQMLGPHAFCGRGAPKPFGVCMLHHCAAAVFPYPSYVAVEVELSQFFQCLSLSLAQRRATLNVSTPFIVMKRLLVHTCYLFGRFCVQLCDAVVVARVLNATLVVPHFDKDSWWDDHRWDFGQLPSNFENL